MGGFTSENEVVRDSCSSSEQSQFNGPSLPPAIRKPVILLQRAPQSNLEITTSPFPPAIVRVFAHLYRLKITSRDLYGSMRSLSERAKLGAVPKACLFLMNSTSIIHVALF